MIDEELLKKLSTADLLSAVYQDLGNVPTGSYAINRIISGSYTQGIPIGHITEIMGESSTGKTVFLSHILREAQKLGHYTLLLDNEFTYDLNFAKSMGVDPDKLLYDHPETIPHAFDKMIKVVDEIRKNDLDTPIVVGLDSMAGQSSEEAETDILDSSNTGGARRAKEISEILRKITPQLHRKKVALVLINQIRTNIMVMHGDPRTRSGGGKSLEYYCTVSMMVKSNKTSDVIKDDNGLTTGIKGEIFTQKNKCFRPFQSCRFLLDYDQGLIPTAGLLQWLERDGFVSRGGGWYTIKSTNKKFQKSEIADMVQTNPEVREFLGLE